MGKPTADELQQALAKAKEMRETGQDPDFIAKALLSLDYRYNEWQKVIKATKQYLHSGASATEHARLVKLIEDVERVELSGDKDSSDFGLE